MTDRRPKTLDRKTIDGVIRASERGSWGLEFNRASIKI